jgi:lipid-A-disaccharide synthase
MNQSEVTRYLTPDLSIFELEDKTYDAMVAADVANVSIGTATVEAALMDAPMIVVYRLAPFTAAVARWLVRTPMFAMVNLIAGRRVVPELVQNDFTPARLATETLRLLDSPAAREEMRQGLADVREKLGPPGAIDRAADIIAAMLSQQPSK